MRTILLAMTLVLLCSHGAAAADCPPRPADTKAAEKLAGDLFGQGVALAESERYTEAQQAFGCSLAIIEHPATLYNGGKAAQLSGDLPGAVALFERYLILAPDGPKAADVKERLVPLKAELARQEAQKQAAEAKAEAKSQVTPPPPVVAPPPPAPAPPNRTLFVPGVVTLSCGGAALIAGGVLQILASSARSRGQATDDTAVFNAADRDQQRFQVGAVVGLAAGAVAVATGVVLLVLDSKHKRTAAEPAAVAVTPAGVSLAF